MAWESMQARGLKIPKPLFLNVANIKSIRYTTILSYITSITIIENHKSPITMVLTLSLSLHMPLPMPTVPVALTMTVILKMKKEMSSLPSKDYQRGRGTHQSSLGDSERLPSP